MHFASTLARLFLVGESSAPVILLLAMHMDCFVSMSPEVLLTLLIGDSWSEGFMSE